MKKAPILPDPRYIVDETGQKTGVILDVKAYNQLIELIEDFGLGKMAQNVLADELSEEYTSLDDLRDSLLKK